MAVLKAEATAAAVAMTADLDRSKKTNPLFFLSGKYKRLVTQLAILSTYVSEQV